MCTAPPCPPLVRAVSPPMIRAATAEATIGECNNQPQLLSDLVCNFLIWRSIWFTVSVDLISIAVPVDVLKPGAHNAFGCPQRHDQQNLFLMPSYVIEKLTMFHLIRTQIREVLQKQTKLIISAGLFLSKCAF